MWTIQECVWYSNLYIKSSLSNDEIWHGMLTPLKYLIPSPLVCPGVCVCPSFNFVILIRVMSLISVLYLYLFILHNHVPVLNTFSSPVNGGRNWSYPTFIGYQIFVQKFPCFFYKQIYCRIQEMLYQIPFWSS